MAAHGRVIGEEWPEMPVRDSALHREKGLYGEAAIVELMVSHASAWFSFFTLR